MDYTKHV